MNRFKFRAECLADVEELQYQLGDKGTWHIEKCYPLPDVEVTLETEASLLVVHSAMLAVADYEEGHVMIETLARDFEYTGEREQWKHGLCTLYLRSIVFMNFIDTLDF